MPSSFGTTAATPAVNSAATAPATGGFSFGAAPAVQAAGVPPTPTAQAAGGINFGSGAAVASAATGTVPAPNTFSFGGAATATPAPTPAPTSGFSFGAGAATATDPATSGAAGQSVGGAAPALGTASKASSTVTSGLAFSSAAGMAGWATAAGGGGLGSIPGITAGSAGAGAAGGVSCGGGTSSKTHVPPMPKAHVEKEIELLMKNLKKQAQLFDECSEEVTNQDITIFETDETCTRLVNDLRRLVDSQTSLDSELDAMEQQQDQLEKDLRRMKKFLETDIQARGGGELRTADLTRIAMSTLAKEVQAGMKSTRLSLTELIAQMNRHYRNSTQSGSGAQSAMQSLNEHHQLFRWLGQTASELEQTVTELERRAQ